MVSFWDWAWGLLISDGPLVGVEMGRGGGEGFGHHIFLKFPADSNVQPGLSASGLK